MVEDWFSYTVMHFLTVQCYLRTRVEALLDEVQIQRFVAVCGLTLGFVRIFVSLFHNSV